MHSPPKISTKILKKTLKGLFALICKVLLKGLDLGVFQSFITLLMQIKKHAKNALKGLEKAKDKPLNKIALC